MIPNRFRNLRRIVLAGLTVLALGGAALAFRPWDGRARDAADGPHTHWRLAEEALKAQDFARAREHLEQCLAAWPADLETRFVLARTCRRADDLDAWQTHLRVAEALHWPADDIRFERQLLQAQVGKLAGVEGPLIEQLTAGTGDDELILEALVKGYVAAYRLKDAAHWATQWLQRRPERWQPWLYRGRAHYLNHNLGRAIADYRRALESRPDHRQGRLWLAGALLLGGQFAEALPEFESYLRDDPDSAAALLGLATSRLELNQQAEAEAALDRLLARHPNHIAGLLVRARLEMARDAPAQALAWLKKAEGVAPDEADILNALVLACRQLGRPADAKAYQQRLDDVQRQSARLEEMRKEIIRSPKAIEPRYEAGVLCLRLGRTEEALEWLRGALSVAPDHRPTHQALADCYAKRGETQRADYHRHRAEKK